MTWLIIGIVIFFGIHLLPSAPAVRTKLLESLGAWPYKGAFAALALVGLALIIKGMGAAEYIAVWHPPVAARIAPAVFMAPALMLLAAMHFDNHIKRIARHPMMWGVLLWSLSHLLANGELATMLLFGSFAAYSSFYLWSVGRRDTVADPSLPLKKVSIKRDLLAVIIGLIAYSVLVTFHDSLFGVAVFL